MRGKTGDVPDRSIFSMAGGTLFDIFTGSPPQTVWAKWFGGVVVPLLLLHAAIPVAWRVPGHWPVFLHGRPDLGNLSVLLSSAFLPALALFVHFHYFWGNLRRLARFSEPAKTVAAGIAALGLIGGLAGYFFSLLW